MLAVLVQMRKEMEAGQWRGMDKQKLAEDQAAQQGAAKVAPKPYMSAQYKEDTMRTTGQFFYSYCTNPLIVDKRPVIPHSSVCFDSCTCMTREKRDDIVFLIVTDECRCMRPQVRPSERLPPQQSKAQAADNPLVLVQSQTKGLHVISFGEVTTP